LGKFGETLALDESTLAIPQVIAQSDKLAAGQSLGGLVGQSKAIAGQSAAPSISGMDLTAAQSDMVCRDVAHMGFYLCFGPTGVVPEVMNHAAFGEMCSAAEALGLKPAATAREHGPNAATSATWTVAQWAGYFWLIITAVRVDHKMPIVLPDWKKLMGNIKILLSKYGTRLWDIVKTFSDDPDKILPDDKKFIVPLNESTLNHATIAQKLERMVGDQTTDAGSPVDWSNHPGNAHLAAMSAQRREIEASKQCQTQTPPTPIATPPVTPAPCPPPAPLPPYGSLDFNSDFPIPDEDLLGTPASSPFAVRSEPVNSGADQPAQEYDFSVDQPIEEYDDRADQPVEECNVCA
jgi:hypothetical protein